MTAERKRSEHLIRIRTKARAVMKFASTSDFYIVPDLLAAPGTINLQ